MQGMNFRTFCFADFWSPPLQSALTLQLMGLEWVVMTIIGSASDECHARDSNGSGSSSFTPILCSYQSNWCTGCPSQATHHILCMTVQCLISLLGTWTSEPAFLPRASWSLLICCAFEVQVYDYTKGDLVGDREFLKLHVSSACSQVLHINLTIGCGCKV